MHCNRTWCGRRLRSLQGLNRDWTFVEEKCNFWEHDVKYDDRQGRDALPRRNNGIISIVQRCLGTSTTGKALRDLSFFTGDMSYMMLADQTNRICHRASHLHAEVTREALHLAPEHEATIVCISEHCYWTFGSPASSHPACTVPALSI